MNERTIHRKLQVVLDVARRAKYESVVELRNALEAEPPTSFMYRKTKTQKFRCSTRSIGRTINLAGQLGLLDKESGRLTEIGMRATDPQKFDRVVGAQAAQYLGQEGAPMSKITVAINKRLLQASPPITPTAVNIWSALDEPLPFLTFVTYLRLLGICGQLATSQNKIFLPK